MMIMEYCEHGSLHARLKSKGLEPDERRLVALDAAMGLEYLASRGTVITLYFRTDTLRNRA